MPRALLALVAWALACANQGGPSAPLVSDGVPAAAAVAPRTDAARGAVDYPSVAIHNEELRVELYLPDARSGFYRGPRFDWSGVIKRVEHAGHRFYAPLYAVHEPHVHDAISGPAGEFGMVSPIGFDEALPGESFVKIGVGLLRKGDRDTYAFDEPYEFVRVGDWRVDATADQVRFSQTLTGERGWGYRYTKVVRLVPGRPELAIDHVLQNTGDKTIDVDHYNHNFTVIDGTPYGPDYTVIFPFSAPTPRSIGGLAELRGDRITAHRPLGDRSLWAPVLEGGGTAADNAATIRNDKTGASVRFQGDAPITRMVFWAVEAAVCPEPFIALLVPPGQERRWSIHYTFAAGQPG
jgi:hypothetical protein